jgi:Flp pilus assembly protein TadB
MEYYVVTKIKNSDVVKKIKAIATKTRKPRRAAVNKTAVEDTAYTEAHDATSHASQSATAKQNISHMIARGKDLVSGDNTSLAAAAAIVLGAALIEVELIPGLVIGAGAILLGKLFPEAGHYVRPAIKSALRAGFSLTQKVQEVLAETSEQVHDLVAEVMHEQKHTSVDQPLASVVESGRDHTTKA